jgi:hypothetical protein
MRTIQEGLPTHATINNERIPSAISMVQSATKLARFFAGPTARIFLLANVSNNNILI